MLTGSLTTTGRTQSCYPTNAVVVHGVTFREGELSQATGWASVHSRLVKTLTWSLTMGAELFLLDQAPFILSSITSFILPTLLSRPWWDPHHLDCTVWKVEYLSVPCMQIVDILYGLNLSLIWEIKRGKSTGESAKNTGELVDTTNVCFICC